MKTQKVLPINSNIRSKLQVKSNLKVLYGSGMSGNNVDLGRDFVIPNGMSQKEMLAYKLTGKLPNSVKERLVDTKNSDYTPGEDDQVLKMNSAGYIYDEPHDIDTGDTDDAESGIDLLFKLVEHIFG